MEFNTPQVTLEIIELKVGAEPSRFFSGFGGSFATLLDSCQRKKTLPGLYEENLITDFERDGSVLNLILSGIRTNQEISRIMDMALENISTFLCSGGEVDYQVVVKCQNS